MAMFLKRVRQKAGQKRDVEGVWGWLSFQRASEQKEVEVKTKMSSEDRLF